MKKIFFLLAIALSISTTQAQPENDLDITKLNLALAGQTITGFTFDSVTVYIGIIGSYKNENGDELVISFDPLSRFEEIKTEDPELISLYKNENTNLIYFQNEYIGALYIELPEYNVTMSLTSSFLGQPELESVYKQINPEVLLKETVKK